MNDIKEKLDDYVCALNRRSCGNGTISEVLDARSAVQAAIKDALDAKDGEIARLTACLETANANAEKFERQWYLRGDDIEALRKDAERLNLLDRQGEAYGVHEHEGNRWLIEGPFTSLRVAIDADIAQAVQP